MQIISATDPKYLEDGLPWEISLRVWFWEFGDKHSCLFVATPFDSEPHGKELWIRAMAGEYGEITGNKPRLLEQFELQQLAGPQT